MKTIWRNANWPRVIRWIIWWAFLTYGMGGLIETFAEPIIGNVAGLIIFLPVLVFGLWKFDDIEASLKTTDSRFWRLMWDRKDWQLWKGMTDAEKAVCSAYRVPPSLLTTRGTQGPQNG